MAVQTYSRFNDGVVSLRSTVFLQCLLGCSMVVVLGRFLNTVSDSGITATSSGTAKPSPSCTTAEYFITKFPLVQQHSNLQAHGQVVRTTLLPMIILSPQVASSIQAAVGSSSCCLAHGQTQVHLASLACRQGYSNC